MKKHLSIHEIYLYRVIPRCIAMSLAIIIFLAYALCGCTTFMAAAIPGEYEYKAWTVEINEDSSYRIFDTETNETIENGTWTYNNADSLLKFEVTDSSVDRPDAYCFVRNNNNFILYSMDNAKPYYYDELLIDDDGTLNFTYEYETSRRKLDLKFRPTGDIVVKGDSFEYGDGTYKISNDKIYASFTYTKSSARNDVHAELTFYIYDKNHIVPDNCIMVKK